MGRKMATSQDYATGTAALAAALKAQIDQSVAAGKIPELAEGMAEQFVAEMAPIGAKATIDAVDASRAKGA